MNELANFKVRESQRDKLAKMYLTLSPAIRSVASQTTIQHHLAECRFENMAMFIKSLEYNDRDPLTKKYGNFWYKLLSGRGIKHIGNLKHFIESICWYSALILRHDLWLFIDGKLEIKDAIKKLDRDLKRQLFTKKALKSRSVEHSIGSFKQSYHRQRLNLYRQQTLGSLEALMIIAMLQTQKYQHSRPSSAEKFAYGQFLYLFGYKYQALKKIEIGHKIALRFSGKSSLSTSDTLHQRLTYDFEKLDEIIAIGRNSKVENLDQFVSEEILKNILSKPNHLYFYS